MKKRILSLFVAIALVLMLIPASVNAATDSIVIMHTNDVHCSVNMDEEKGIIGYAGVAAAKKEYLAKGYKYVTLVDAGDFVQGGPIGTLSKGMYLADIMNKVGYDVVTLGNHEFDYGMSQLLDNIVPALDAAVVSANFVNTADSSPVLDAYKIIEYNGVKVAYVGISTPESITKSTPTYFQDGNGKYIYGFCQENNGADLYAAVQKAVDAALAEGANYVVAVAHLGIDEQSAPWRSTDVIANTTGINVVIDGHSHSIIEGEIFKNKEGMDVVLASTGTALNTFGVVMINADGTIETEIVDEYTKVDGETLTHIQGIESQFKALLATVVANTSVDLVATDADGNRIVRGQETNLGDLCADAYKNLLGADVAFVNGGGVRANIPAGDITYEQIINVHPFGNMACLVEATGQEIVDALEMASRITPELNGGFLQVSGISYEIHTFVPSSVTVDENGMFVSVDGAYRVNNVKVDGKPIDLAKTYKLASHNYMLKSGGDGINMFIDNVILQDEVLIDNQVLINYIVDNLSGTVGEAYANADGDGRIAIYENEADVPAPESNNTIYFVIGGVVILAVVLFFVLKKKKPAAE